MRSLLDDVYAGQRKDERMSTALRPHVFAEQGREAPAPSEVPLLDAVRGDSTRFALRDGVEQTRRIFERLIQKPPPVHKYASGSRGPAAADQLVAGFAGLHGPWVAS